MHLHAITGIMARRMLINYRVDARVAARLLPAGIRPRLVGGYAIAGFCLVRVTQMRPVGLPARAGFTSENVAVRTAVEWGPASAPQRAVLIFRRDTGSWMNVLAGGRLLPGPTGPARVTAYDRHGEIRIAVRCPNDANSIDIAAREAGAHPTGSVFATVEDATEFFRAGPRGYSPARTPGLWDGLSLELARWDICPLAVNLARSTFISTLETIYPGSTALDSAFIMRDIPHTWTALPALPLGELPRLPSAPMRPARRRGLAGIVQPDLILH